MGHGYWLRPGATQQKSTARASLATSGGYARTSTCLLGFTLGGASQWRLRAGSSRPTPLAPADTTRKATRHTWLGPSPTHMQPSQCKTMPEPWSSFCPITPSALSGASASAQWHHHHHHPWTMTLGWSLPERDKANACCLPLLHCSTALVMDPRGRNLWALGYNTATCCRDAFPPPWHGIGMACHVIICLADARTYCNRRTDATCEAET